jgi:hypothetical protein
MSPGVIVVDDRAAGGAGQGLAGVNQQTLAEEVLSKNPNRQTKHPFRSYWERVLVASQVPDGSETRKMASMICGEVAKLPFVPDGEANSNLNPTLDLDHPAV